MSVPIQPLGEYVVVQPEQAQTKTASGLYLPDSAKEKPKTSVVVAIGSDVKDVKVGDRILFKNDYESTQVKLDKDEYTILYHKNIIAIVK